MLDFRYADQCYKLYMMVCMLHHLIFSFSLAVVIYLDVVATTLGHVVTNVWDRLLIYLDSSEQRKKNAKPKDEWKPEHGMPADMSKIAFAEQLRMQRAYNEWKQE